MVLGLRQKILLAFAGLFLLLVVVAALGLVVIGRVSGSFDEVFRENLASIQACSDMQATLLEAHQGLLESLGDTARSVSEAFRSAADGFETSLRFQQGNITLAGERALTDSLTSAWSVFRRDGEALLHAREPVGLRHLRYRSTVLPAFRELLRLARAIASLNSTKVLSADGRVRGISRASRSALLALLVPAGLLILVLLPILGRSIMTPVRALTRSAQEIAQGNLEMTLAPGSRDELGQLAEAFNAMAARLREFRRADREKLDRIRGSTQIAINSLPDAVALLGPDGKVELSNDSAAGLFGLRPGASLLDLKLPGLGALFEQAKKGMMPIHPESYGSALQVFQGGKEHIYLPNLVPLPDGEGSFSGLTLVLADVTELRRLDEAKSDLLSTLSHELKTRLTSIRMTLHLLKDAKVGELNSMQWDLVSASLEDGERLHRLIEDLLDIGRIRAGRFGLEFKPVDPGDLVRRAASAFLLDFGRKGVELVVRLAEDLPPVLADETRVPLVFSNLLTNALTHTDLGGKVEIEASPEAAEVRFRVRDNGAGIPPAEIPRIFEKFYRGARGTEAGGAGLGLAIAREIIAAHGGDIQVASSLGQGSTFTFTLKRAGTRYA